MSNIIPISSYQQGRVDAHKQLAVKIVNSRGVPGTLGCIARYRNSGQPILLSNWHVFYGEGAVRGDAIWFADETGETRCYILIGRTLHGNIGKVRHNGEEFYVDCAVGSFLCPAEIKIRWPIVNTHATAKSGDVVMKAGAASGTTFGIVVDTQYSNSVWNQGRLSSVHQQLLLRSLNPMSPFSAEGDSGAMVINLTGEAVGLLWGTNTRGDGIACPMAPVLNSLNIELE